MELLWGIDYVLELAASAGIDSNLVMADQWTLPCGDLGANHAARSAPRASTREFGGPAAGHPLRGHYGPPGPVAPPTWRNGWWVSRGMSDERVRPWRVRVRQRRRPDVRQRGAPRGDEEDFESEARITRRSDRILYLREGISGMYGSGSHGFLSKRPHVTGAERLMGPVGVLW